MAITASTRCCGYCDQWYYGYSCPYCNGKKKQRTDNRSVKSGKEKSNNEN